MASSAIAPSERVQAILAIPDQHAWLGTVPPWLGAPPETTGIARFIDHTLLRPDATATEIEKVAREGRAFGVASVCVNGRWVARVRDILSGSPVKTCAVIGFPLGTMVPEAKAHEAACALEHGAAEIDMVMSLGDGKAGDWDLVERDIARVRAAAPEVVLKVILETALLGPADVVRACFVAQDAGADFVKTSTGFSAAGGASEHVVRLMRRAVGERFGVKASGGVRSGEMALRMLEAGANRLGMSATAELAPLLGAAAPTLVELFKAPPEAAPAPAGY